MSSLNLFLPHSETPLTITLKLFDFEDTSLRHTFHVKQFPCILSCYHGNRITKGTLRTFVKYDSVIYGVTELKFGTETNFEPLSSETDIKLHNDVIVTS